MPDSSNQICFDTTLFYIMAGLAIFTIFHAAVTMK